MAGSKLTLHCQSVPGWSGAFLARGGSTHIKCIGSYATFPGVATIGRVYYDQGQVDARVASGAVGAGAMFSTVWPEVESNPQVALWETPANEASIWEPSVAAGYVAFNQRLVQLFHDAGKRVIVGAVNTGWPRLASEDGGAMMRLVQEAAAGADGLSFHEYGANDMRVGATYNCLRYRRFHDWCAANGRVHPPIYITECGLDRPDGGPCFGHSGWVQVLGGDEQAYVEQLLWYEAELRQDDYVEAATIFTAGPAGWWCFEVTESLAMRLADGLAALEDPEEPMDPFEPVPIEQMARGLDVSEYQGEVDWPAVYADGYRFAMLRASSGLHADETFAANWTGAGEAGLLRGAYHYLDPFLSGQALHFQMCVGDRALELGHWGDLESADLTAEKCRGFLEAADGRFGTTTHVYTRASFFDRYGEPSWAQGRRLWVAHWGGVSAPVLPASWDRWEWWQHTSDGAINGISGRVDLDRYWGTVAQLHEHYGGEEPPEPEEPMDLVIYDKEGTARDWAWVIDNYGAVGSDIIDGRAFKLVQLTEVEGPMAFTCTVLNEAGGPVVGVPVAYIWPDGELLEITNGSGLAEHTAGAGEGYDPHTGTGPISWQVRVAGEVSETVSGLGWIWGTNHRHLNVTFRLGDDEEPEPPEPPDNGEGEIAAALDRMTEQVARLAAQLEQGIAIKISLGSGGA